MQRHRHAVADGQVAGDRRGSDDPQGEAEQVVARRGDRTSVRETRCPAVPFVENQVGVDLLPGSEHLHLQAVGIVGAAPHAGGSVRRQPHRLTAQRLAHGCSIL